MTATALDFNLNHRAGHDDGLSGLTPVRDVDRVRRETRGIDPEELATWRRSVDRAVDRFYRSEPAGFATRP